MTFGEILEKANHDPKIFEEASNILDTTNFRESLDITLKKVQVEEKDKEKEKEKFTLGNYKLENKLTLSVKV